MGNDTVRQCERERRARAQASPIVYAVARVRDDVVLAENLPPLGSERTARKLATREGEPVELYEQRGSGPGLIVRPRTKARKYQFRAIRWHRSSDETETVGPWRASKCEALTDAYADYAPHKRAFWEIERSDGRRQELTERQHENAEAWYHDSIATRNARGVWG